jgi:GMP synthase-like glutamine amidotransferase
MTKKFLAIIPENAAPPALIGEALLEMGHAYDAIYPIDRYASHSPLSYTGLPSEPGAYAGLIMMGGPMSANDVADHAFLEESMSLIRSFGLAKKPVLGICLGAQVIARAYGGEVFRMSGLEAGYVGMHTTEAAAADPVFKTLTGKFTAFHTHYDAVRNIPDAVVLASGGMSAVQAFRVGAKTYGMQFHPEATIDIARDWVRKFGAVFCKDEPRLITHLDQDFAAHYTGSSRFCRNLVQNWSRLA